MSQRSTVAHSSHVMTPQDNMKNVAAGMTEVKEDGKDPNKDTLDAAQSQTAQ